jgi:hypothetical protein
MVARGPGVDGLIQGVEQVLLEARRRGAGDGWAMLRLGEDYANIRLGDVRRPLRFLRQMAGAPPLRLGTTGFRAEYVDDHNPARHYMAFVLLGYWLPRWMALTFLLLWEVAGWIRYGFVWSPCDLACGVLGVRHGGWVRRYGAVILPGLIAGELADGSCEVPVGGEG